MMTKDRVGHPIFMLQQDCITKRAISPGQAHLLNTNFPQVDLKKALFK